MIKKITLWFCALTFLIIITTSLFQYQIGGDALKAKIDSLHGAGFVVRGLFFIVVFGYWDQLVGWVSKNQQWHEVQLERALKARWKVAFYMGMVEVLIIQNLIGKVVAELTVAGGVS